MTQAQKLEALIHKAIDRGLSWSSDFEVNTGDELGSIHDGLMCRFADELVNVEAIIFNHDFAKALWGNDELNLVHHVSRKGEEFFDFAGGKAEVAFDGGGVFAYSVPKYLYHLQQAVVSDNAIDYMYEAVFANVCRCGHESSEHQADGPDTYCEGGDCDCEQYEAVFGDE